MQRGSFRSGSHILIRTFLILFLSGPLVAAEAHADTFKAPDPGTGSVTITGPWQFQTSDIIIPQYAQRA